MTRKRNKVQEAAYCAARYQADPERYKSGRKRSADTHWERRLIDTIRVSRKVTARRAAMPFTIAREDLSALWAKQGGLCYLSGVPMVKEARSLFSVSVDRLDNSRGYERDNVALVSKAANLARNTSTVDEFHVWLKAVRQS